ncbi:hypothetical protein DYU11_29665 [Fibrisoma montanum]|uniref:VWA domain-containing protein n=1 Tax=Fibrisoma montanum TaxID=2305895 RepID=A0A418LY17_9BACT|nr:hypothetical protein [Fibrisoma montanum]RIV18125.1 hypothetical protein DYU11_29665 [Fibrisoma montanum]
MIRTRFSLVLLLTLGAAWWFSGCNLAPQEETPTAPKADTIRQINVFLETSASMNGYLRGSTEFKDIVSELVTKAAQIEPVRRPLALYTIDKDLKPYSGGVSAFVESLATTPLATGKSSELHRIFEQVGAKARNGEVAILISDCVLSFPDAEIRKNPEINRTDASSVLKNAINQQFAQLRKDTISASVYAFESAFNGTYYDYQNKKQVLNGEQRPFYVWAIGKQRVLTLFNQQLQERLNAKPEHRLDFGAGQTVTDYNLFFTLNREGETWEADKPAINNLKKVKPDAPAEFALGVDLSGLPAYAQTEEFLTKNLAVSAGNARVKLVKVEERDDVKDAEKLKANESRMLSESSHVLTFRVSQLFDAQTPVTITLPVRYDTWYVDQSTMDDRTPENRQGKTFALQHLMNGVREAYETGAGSFLKLSVTLNQ